MYTELSVFRPKRCLLTSWKGVRKVCSLLQSVEIQDLFDASTIPLVSQCGTRI